MDWSRGSCGTVAGILGVPAGRPRVKAFCYSSGANRLTSEMCKEFETPFKIPKRKEGLTPMEAAVTV